MTTPDDTQEALHRAMDWAEAPAWTCASCRAPATHWAVGPDGNYGLHRYCIDHAFEAVGTAEMYGRWTVRAIHGASQALALSAEVRRLRAECDVLRAAAQEYLAALDAANAYLAEATLERDDPTYTALIVAEQAAESRLRALAGEGAR